MPDRCEFVAVVGCMRSGTSILRTLLDSHSQIAIPPESDLIRTLILSTKRCTIPVDEYSLIRATVAGSPHVGKWDVPREELLRSLEGPDPVRGYIEGYLRVHSVYAQHHGATIGGDKTPQNVHYMPEMSRVMPQARFVHIIRDGRDVIPSILRSGLGPTIALRAAQLWTRAVSDGRKAGERLPADRYKEVRYEQLTSDPRGTAEELCDFLGVGFEPSMLHTNESGRRYAAAMSVPHLARLADPIAPRATPADRDRPTWSRLGALEEMRSTLRALGYSDDSTDALQKVGKVSRRCQQVYIGSARIVRGVSRRIERKADLQVRGKSGHTI